MGTGLSGKYAIVGFGETPTGKLPGRSTMSLHQEAIKNALEDAGLTNRDVDGVLSNQPLHDTVRCYAVMVAHAAGITPRYTTDLAMGGATPAGMAQHAAMAIEAGLCHTVVCVHARNQATRHLLPQRSPLRDGTEDFEEPYGLLGAVANHALAARRHMYEFGTTSEQLGAIAVAARKHAVLNANATMSRPITLDDHQNSRWIVEPLHLLDCSLNSDGGGAYIVTSVERAMDMKQRPIYILGFGNFNPHSSLADAPTITTLGGKEACLKQAYQMAGLTAEDIDFAEIYDCFTITTLITLEDYGFCPKGAGGSWVEGGRIELGGELPVNTHGGLLSQAHIEGMLHVTEAVKQLRGGTVEPERQVPDARVGIVSGHAGSLHMHSTLILGNEPVA